MKRSSQKRRVMKKEPEITPQSSEHRLSPAGGGAGGGYPSGGGRGEASPVIVVGVGFTAGSEKSLKHLFAKIPAGRGLAFVLVRHERRSQKGMSIRELKKLTSLTVAEPKDGSPVLADHVYVIPPDKYLNISESTFTLHEPILCSGLRMPIDHFFCSLAAAERRRGIGILLAGRGSDGTLGLSEIKSMGGRTFVEDPGKIKRPNMSQSAINAGVADAVMPASGMAEAILMFAEQDIAETRVSAGEAPGIDAGLRAILDILHAKIGHDFRCYKPNTLVRRIRRRIDLAKVASFEDYADFLQGHTEEVELLQKDLLIGVTDFFRQPHAWDALEQKVITPLVEAARPGSEIRAWIPGCSTGKEAYSLAMLFTEQIEKSGKDVKAQIFATDSDLTALATARSGVYPKTEFGENISPERLKRFFTHKDGQYQVVKEIRGHIVFAPQNITADPPFSRLDLISCRNLLIYLDQEVQKKIITLFHFALREGGFLFLGTAETVGDREELFESVSKKWRIYKRIGVGHRVGIEIPVRITPESGRVPATMPPPAPRSRMSLVAGAQQVLLDRFTPACVMIDRKLQVLYVHGAVENYLTFPPGELTTRVVDMAREGLRARLRGAIAKCLESNKAVAVTARVRRGDKSFPVKTVISPLRYPREIDGLLLITFEDYHLPVAKKHGKLTEGRNTQHLLDELKITREELQSTIDQLENSNDELKASNEEVTATNEELQSANEELETSKEELQSLNEELNTINMRLQEKVDELESVNNDVINLLSSTDIATIFLDKDLRVKRYTPAITRLFSLIPSDVGRYIGDVLRKFSDDALLADARRVLGNLTPLSAEAQDDAGRWHIRRITSYRTQDDRIEGVVITFSDVDDLKRAQEVLTRFNQELEDRVNKRTAELREAKETLEQRVAERTAELQESQRRLGDIVDSIADGFFAIDRRWQITHANDSALLHFRRNLKEIVGHDFFEVFPEARGGIFETEYRKAMETGRPTHFETPSLVSDLIIEVHAYPGEENLAILFRDITERKRAEERIRQHNSILNTMNRIFQKAITCDSEEGLGELCLDVAEELTQSKIGFIGEIGPDGLFHDIAISNPGWEACEMYDKTGHRRPPGDFKVHGLYGRVLTDGKSLLVNDPSSHPDSIGIPDGHPPLTAFLGVPLIQRGRTVGMVAVGNREGGYTEDQERGLEAITPVIMETLARKRAEAALHDEHERAEWLARFPGENPNPVMRVAADGKVLYCNPASIETHGWPCAIGKQVPDIFLALLEQAMTTGNEAEQDVDLGEGSYWITITPFPEESYANIYGRDITERKRAEEALLESEERFRAIASSTPDHILKQDRDLRYSFVVNPQLGLTEEDMIGKTDYDILEKEEADKLTAIKRRVIDTGEPVQLEAPLTDVAGKLQYFEGSYIPTFGENKQVTGLIGYFKNITARKQAEDALRESEKRYRSLFAHMLDGFAYCQMLFDEHGHPDDFVYLAVNDAFGRLTGLNDVIGKRVTQIIPRIKELNPELFEIYGRVASTGSPERFEIDFKPLGLYLSVSVYGPTKGYFVAVFDDVTERKRAEEQVKQSQKTFSELVERAPFGIYIVDSQFRIAQMNVGSQNGAFRNVRPVIGRDFSEAMHILWPDDVAAEIVSHFRHTLETGEPYYSPRFTHPRHDAEIVESYEWELHRMMLPDGQYGVICYYFDSTALRNAEAAVSEKALELDTILATMPIPVFIAHDPESLHITGNPAADKLLHNPAGSDASLSAPEDKRPHHFKAIKDGRELDLNELPAQRAARGEHVRDFEFSLAFDDGTTRHVVGSGMPLIDERGNPRGSVLALTDITERKQFEESLAAQREELQLIVDSSPAMIFYKDKENHFLRVNHAFAESMALAKEDLEGRSLFDLYPRQQAEAFWRDDKEAMETGRPKLNILEPMQTPAGVRWLETHKVPSRDAQGNIVGVIGFAVDITERKEKEERIAKLTRLYSALSRVNETIVRVRDENTLFNEVCRILSEEGNLPLVWIGEVEDKQVVPVAWFGTAGDYLKKIKVETEGTLGQGPTGTSIRENRPMINDDFAINPTTSPWRETALHFGFRGSAAFPLQRRGKAIGALTLYSPVPGAFDEDQVRLLEALSADISYALDAVDHDQMRMRAEEHLKESEGRFRLLSLTAGRLLSTDDPQNIVEDICREVMAHLDCQAFFNFLVDEKSGKLHLNACAGIPEEDARAIEWLDYGVAVCGCVAQAKERIIAEDILNTPDIRTDLVKSYGIQAYCCHPLIAQGHLIGTLSFGKKTWPHFNEDEVELMRIIADQVAVAMQRKQAQEAVSRAKREWERTFDAVPDLIAILDDQYHILRSNKAMADRLGLTPAQCIGKNCHEAVHGKDCPPALCPHTLSLADGQEHVAEVHEESLGGDFLISTTPLTDEHGWHIGSVHVARDITKRKQAEEALKERTRELEILNKELESFSYSVSHDLRAPLRAIDGYARSILKKQEDKFDEDTKRKFNDIRSNARMMGQLIDDLLAFSRLGKKHISISRLDMDAVIADVWKELQTTNPERNMKLTFQSMPNGYGDRTLIKQIYLNLLSNAVKFTKTRDAAHIEVGGYTEGDENIYYVKDNGVGFDMAYYDKLFGVFQRLHSPDDFDGTGVGLATVQRIVHRHEGRVWAEGKVNEGATFYFTLPVKR